MKYSIFTILALTLTLPGAYAQNQQQQQNGNNGQPSQPNGYAQSCVAVLKEGRQNQNAEAPTPPTEEFTQCEAVETVALKYGGGHLLMTDGYQTADGRATCKLIAGYTLDFDSCVSTAQMYDGLLVAAQALEMQAELRAQNSHKEIAQKAQQQALAGDVQGAGLQASKENSSTMKQINNEKAVAYTAAVAALGAKIATWVDDANDACDGQKDCLEAIKKTEGAGIARHMFANKNQKSVFIQALAEFTAKGLAAGIAASQYKSGEEAVAKIQDSYEEDLLDIQFDECAMNPTAKQCLGPGTRIAGERYSGGGVGNFALGGGESNSFDMGTGSDEFGELGDIANIESQQVAAINSPFKDQVKEANDILDQAGAASAGSGGDAPAGGGGGGGGMGGGGSASLGNDTKTPDETPEEAEIKAKKASGSYASGGAKGFSGVKSSKDDTNPFASLFDQKGSSGGLEEDRSIASNDIDDKSSVLFQKISKKYSEMHSNKRIEANNLE